MAERSDGPPTVDLSTWSPETELLAAAVDRLGTVIAALIAFGGGTAPTIEPWPRPVTAAQRYRSEYKFARHRELVRRLLPEGDDSQ